MAESAKVAASIKEFGFRQPIVVDDEMVNAHDIMDDEFNNRLACFWAWPTTWRSITQVWGLTKNANC